MATLMLEGGADIRFIQQMLGHARLTSTEIYTQVSIRALQAIHAATHPGARLRRERADTSERDAIVAGDELHDQEQRAELLSRLAAEAAEEPDG
jgi:integrase/recombinase XerD